MYELSRSAGGRSPSVICVRIDLRRVGKGRVCVVFSGTRYFATRRRDRNWTVWTTWTTSPWCPGGASTPTSPCLWVETWLPSPNIKPLPLRRFSGPLAARTPLCTRLETLSLSFSPSLRHIAFLSFLSWNETLLSPASYQAPALHSIKRTAIFKSSFFSHFGHAHLQKSLYRKKVPGRFSSDATTARVESTCLQTGTSKLAG